MPIYRDGQAKWQGGYKVQSRCLRLLCEPDRTTVLRIAHCVLRALGRGGRFMTPVASLLS